MSTLTNTITATIEPGTAGRRYLVVTIDGEPRCFEINMNWLALHAPMTVCDEAARLLRRVAGYEPAGEWREAADGAYVVDVADVPGRCRVCVHGCGCNGNGRGCGHFACWAADERKANTCPGAAVAAAAHRPRRRNTRQRKSR